MFATSRFPLHHADALAPVALPLGAFQGHALLAEADAPGVASRQRTDPVDALEEMRRADDADRTLLALVLCAAAATLVLALAANLSL